MNKTPEMRRIEDANDGREIADIVKDAIAEHGVGRAAGHLEVSRATLGAWRREFGIRTERRDVVIGEGR